MSCQTTLDSDATDSEGIGRVDPEALKRLLMACFQATGFPEANAEVIARHLVDAERMGVASHGILRLHSYLDQVKADHIDPRAEPRLRDDDGALITVDGGRGIGIPAMEFALDRAMARAETTGAAVAGIVNCAHTGRLGTYVQRAAAAGFVALCLGGGGRRKWANVAPFGASEGAMSTNPIAAAFPGEPGREPFSDFATSAISTGKAALCQATGSLLPEGVAVDKAGQPTRCPEDLVDGGILTPAGGAKGSGLAVFAELVGDALLGPAHEFNWLMIVVRGDGFRPLKTVRRDAAAFADKVRSLRPLAGFDRVQAPGDPERAHAHRSDETGLRIDKAVRAKVIAAARSVGIDARPVFAAVRCGAPADA